MERRGHGQQHRALGALGLGDLDRALDRRLVAGHDDLPGAIVIGGLADFALRGFAAPPLEACAKSRPSSAAIAPVPTGTAFCIAWPRVRNSRAASAMLNAPAAASAEYSPSEWPATNCASRLRSTPGFRFEHAHRRQRNRHQRRLRILGQRERVGGPLEDDRRSASRRAPHRPRRTRRAPARKRRPAPCPCRPPGCPAREIRMPRPFPFRFADCRPEKHRRFRACQVEYTAVTKRQGSRG